MNETIKTTEPLPAEQHNQGRRTLIKILAAGGGAVTASALLPASWFSPVVEIGVLPAHAQVSSIATAFYLDQLIPVDVTGKGVEGPAAIKASVDAATGIAHVEAVTSRRDLRLGIELMIDGTPSNAFTVLEFSCSSRTPGANWSVVGYKLGDQTLRIASSGGEGSWEVVLQTGTGLLPALLPCTA